MQVDVVITHNSDPNLLYIIVYKYALPGSLSIDILYFYEIEKVSILTSMVVLKKGNPC